MTEVGKNPFIQLSGQEPGRGSIVLQKAYRYSLYSAKTQDIERLAHRSSGRKNPGLYKPINKATDIELVIGPTYRFAPGSGPQRTQQ